MSVLSLHDRLKNGGTLVVAEGYVFEFERKGYLKAGSFVPEVVIEHPELVRQQYEEFVHAGSDVVLAFTYYAHREKLRLINREKDLVAMNTKALQMARQVADTHGCLMAGNICNTNAYTADNSESLAAVEAIFKEQIELAVEQRADYIVAETFAHCGEALLALECIKRYGQGLPGVITVAAPPEDRMIDEVSVVDTCLRLEKAGAAVVGLNCWRGPATMIPLIRKIKAACKVPIAALPVPFRTSTDAETFYSLKIPGTGRRAFPLDLATLLCSRTEIADFAQECRELGVQYIGLCCGASANLVRIVAESYGRTPGASRYGPEMHKHFMFGKESGSSAHYQQECRKLVKGDFD